MKKLLALLCGLAMAQTLDQQERLIATRQRAFVEEVRRNTAVFNARHEEFAQELNAWVALRNNVVGANGERDKKEAAQWEKVKEKWGFLNQAGEDWSKVREHWLRLEEAVDGKPE